MKTTNQTQFPRPSRCRNSALRGILSALTIVTAATTTFAIPNEADFAWKLQFRMIVADKDHAGTDANVSVSLNETHKTLIDRPGNDFVRGENALYYLLHNNVNTFQDIRHLKLKIHRQYKPGTTTFNNDGLCLKRFELVVNGKVLYSQDYGTNGRWFDVEKGTDELVISSSQLRQSTTWKSYVTPPLPSRMEFDTIAKRVAAFFGDAFAQSKKDFHWRTARGVWVFTPDTFNPSLQTQLSQAQRLGPAINNLGEILPVAFPPKGDHANDIPVEVLFKQTRSSQFDPNFMVRFYLHPEIRYGTLNMRVHGTKMFMSKNNLQSTVEGLLTMGEFLVTVLFAPAGALAEAVAADIALFKKNHNLFLAYTLDRYFGSGTVKKSTKNAATIENDGIVIPCKSNAQRVLLKKIGSMWNLVVE